MNSPVMRLVKSNSAVEQGIIVMQRPVTGSRPYFSLFNL